MRRAGDLMNSFIMTQETYDKLNEDKLTIMQESNVPDDVIAAAMLEWKGGKCAKCGKAYVQRHSNNIATKIRYRHVNGRREEYEEKKVFSDFYYYDPQCCCMKDFEKSRKKEDGIKDRIGETGIPAAFLDVEFCKWDYSVDSGTTECMKKALYMLEDGSFFMGLGVVLCGTPGRGKTNVAVCMFRWMIEQTQKSLRFEPMADLINKILHRGEGKDYESELLLYDVILMDDIDKVHAANEWVKTRVFNIIDAMLRAKKHIIITTNFLTIAEFSEKFDPAVQSRIVGECKFILFPEGDDYRKLRKVRELKKNATGGKK